MNNHVTAKLANMRKPQEFSVMPRSDNTIQVQSERAIGAFDPKTGAGRLNTKGCYFPHLAAATPYQFPPEFVEQCLRACPSHGGETDLGGLVVRHTIQVIG